jgi:uncharacterized repeat protein (TIGR01451 family)
MATLRADVPSQATAIPSWKVIDANNNDFYTGLPWDGSNGVGDDGPGAVDVVGCMWQAQDGSRSLDLGGGKDSPVDIPSGGAGGVQQTVTTVPGKQYQVSFYMAAHPGWKYPDWGSVAILAYAPGYSNQFDYTGGVGTPPNMGWELKTFSFTATGTSSKLAFTRLKDGVWGPTLDNVRVTDIPCSVSDNGTTIQLTGNASSSTTTDSSGYFEFYVPRGTYTVTEIPRPGYTNCGPAFYNVTFPYNENSPPHYASFTFCNREGIPAISVTKTGDPVSKVGDNVTYMLTIDNIGEVDVVAENVTDSLAGDITALCSSPGVLAVGSSVNVTYVYEVKPEDDGSVLINTVTALYRDTFWGNLASASANFTVTLLHPSISVTKTVDPISKAGDTVLYTINIENTGDVELYADNITDSMKGDITGLFTSSNPLGVGSSDNISYTYVISPDDPDPVVNSVAANFHLEYAYLPNDISDNATAYTNLVHPGILVTKKADRETAIVTQNVKYTITITNTSPDVTLVKDSIYDSLLGDITSAFPGEIPANTSVQTSFDRKVTVSDPNPLINTVTAHYHPLGLENDLWDTGIAQVAVLYPMSSMARYDGQATGVSPSQSTPPNLMPKYIAVNPRAARVNQPITITTNVVNEGQVTGSHVVALTINGRVEQTKTVTVGPGATRQVSFTISKAEPGSYQVSIGNQRSDFVVAGDQKTQPVGGISGLLMALTTLVLVVLTGLLVITVRRRRQQE